MKGYQLQVALLTSATAPSFTCVSSLVPGGSLGGALMNPHLCLH